MLRINYNKYKFKIISKIHSISMSFKKKNRLQILIQVFLMILLQKLNYMKNKLHHSINLNLLTKLKNKIRQHNKVLSNLKKNKLLTNY